jgi:hypothetical protein
VKELLRPVPIAAVLLSIGFAVFGQFVISGICLVAWVGTLAIGSMREASVIREADVLDRLDEESRVLFLPVRRTVIEIEQIVERNSELPSVRALGRTTLTEAVGIRDQVGKALLRQTELKRMLTAKGDAQRDMTEIAAKGVENLSDSERAALSALRTEIDGYLAIADASGRIGEAVQAATSILLEARARLASEVSGSRAMAAESVPDLRETLERLQAVTMSYGEANEVLGNTSP